MARNRGVRAYRKRCADRAGLVRPPTAGDPWCDHHHQKSRGGEHRDRNEPQMQTRNNQKLGHACARKCVAQVFVYSAAVAYYERAHLSGFEGRKVAIDHVGDSIA
jgi:hypothetical protein